MDSQAQRLTSEHALSLTTIASMLAPTGGSSQPSIPDNPGPPRSHCRSEPARDELTGAAFNQ